MFAASLPVVGHDWAVSLLLRAVQDQRAAHAYLITGPEHVGKSTLARALAQALNCTGPSLLCGQCRACKLISSGRHPDVVVLAPEGNTLKIDQVRALQHSLALSPVEGRFRVAVLEGMERATPEAQNAMLKTLEEPPPHVVLILVAPEAESLLPTIVSRCQLVGLRPLSIPAVHQALVERFGVEDAKAETLAHLSGGRIGWAITASQDESVLARRAEVLDDLVMLVSEGRVERFAYAEVMASQPALVRDTLALWQTWWRDVMLLAGGSSAAITNLDRRDTLQRHADRFGVEAARKILVALDQTLWQLDHNANARLALEVLLLDLPKNPTP